MVSKASEDLPDPLTPVITIRDRDGSLRSTFLRLWVRAPRTTMWPRAALVVAMLLRAILGKPEQSMVAQRLPRHQPGQKRREPPVPAVCYFVGTCRQAAAGGTAAHAGATTREHLSVRLFIGNLPYAASEAELREHL